MRRIAITCLICCLAACKGGSSRVYLIREFTPVLQSEVSGVTPIADAPMPVTSWEDGVNFVNTKPSHVNIGIRQFKKHNITKGDIVAPPIIAENKLIVLDKDAYIKCYDIDSWKLLWSRNVNFSKNKAYSGGGISYDDGRIFVTSGHKYITAMDITTGDEIFRRIMPDITKTPPVVHNNLLYIMTLNNQFIALNKTTGETVWKNEGTVEMLVAAQQHVPAPYKDNVFINYSSGQSMMLDQSGKALWGRQIENIQTIKLPEFVPVGIGCQPIIDNGFAFIATSNNNLLKVNLNDGLTVWSKPISDILSMNKFGNVLIITTNARQVAAIDMSNGKVIWGKVLDEDKQKLDTYNILTPIMLNNELVIINSNGMMHHLDLVTGDILTLTKIKNGAKYFAAANNKFYIFTTKEALVFEDASQ